MADRYDENRSNQGSGDTSYRNRDDQRSDYGYGRAGGSGYGNDRDTRAGYSGYEGRDYQDRYSQRGTQAEGASGRNWAERAGDEVKSWVGDDEAERRRQQDTQRMGRYPGDDRGQDGYQSDRGYGQTGRGSYGQQFGDPGYGQSGDYGSSRYAQGQGYGSRTAPISGDYAPSGYRRDQASGAYGQPGYGQQGSYGARQSGYTPSSHSAYDDRVSQPYRGDDRVHDSRTQGRDNWASNNTSYNADDRGFFDKAGDEVKSWFGDQDAERRREMDTQRSDAQGAFGGETNRGSNNQQSLGYTGSTSANTPSMTHHDPDYQSYRKARLDEYDRDYHEYKQTKQKEFHDDFHAFRTQKAGGKNSDATGLATSGSAVTNTAMGVGAGAAYGAATAGSTSYGASFSGGTAGGMADKIKEHMVVDGSDGQGVGKVDHVLGGDIKLTKHDSTDGKHHLIPLSWVASVEGDKVKLNKTSDQAMKEWRVADPAQGSGTVGPKAQA